MSASAPRTSRALMSAPPQPEEKAAAREPAGRALRGTSAGAEGEETSRADEQIANSQGTSQQPMSCGLFLDVHDRLRERVDRLIAGSRYMPVRELSESAQWHT